MLSTIRVRQIEVISLKLVAIHKEPRFQRDDYSSVTRFFSNRLNAAWLALLHEVDWLPSSLRIR
jgi:hypothetical protein